MLLTKYVKKKIKGAWEPFMSSAKMVQSTESGWTRKPLHFLSGRAIKAFAHPLPHGLSGTLIFLSVQKFHQTKNTFKCKQILHLLLHQGITHGLQYTNQQSEYVHITLFLGKAYYMLMS